MDVAQKISDAHRTISNALAAAPTTEIDYPAGAELDGWILAPDALRFIAALVAAQKPEHLIEFGAGVSTRILAAACSKLPHPTAISSIDHDPEFGAVALPRALAAAGPESTIRLQIAPIVARLVVERFAPVYYIDRTLLASDRPADIVVIDGPPHALGGRAGVLFQAMELLRPGSIVLLDDSAREAEQKALALWRKTFGDAIEIIDLPGFERGMSAIIVREPVPLDQIGIYSHRKFWNELESHLPTDEACVVIEDAQLFDGHQKSEQFLPFIERNGEYWGHPSDDDEAVAELKRMRDDGARFLAVSHQAFWWLEYYSGFARHIEKSYACTTRNDRMILFDLHTAPDGSRNGR